MLLLNRVAIITGGSTGMGKGIALKFAEEGCNIAIADVNANEANKTINEVIAKGREGLFIKCDITNSSEVKNMVNEVINKFGKIDILVNNAGGIMGVKNNSVATILEDEWDNVVAVNLKGAFLCSKEVVPYMKEKRDGKIVNISSLGAVHPPAPKPHYHSAKAGILGLTYDMACELGASNIRVNAIMPGPIRTPFYDALSKSMTEEELEALFQNLGNSAPLKRMGTPEDIAGAALFLASELSSYVTGAVLPVSGGLPLQPNVR